MSPSNKTGDKWYKKKSAACNLCLNLMYIHNKVISSKEFFGFKHYYFILISTENSTHLKESFPLHQFLIPCAIIFIRILLKCKENLFLFIALIHVFMLGIYSNNDERGTVLSYRATPRHTYIKQGSVCTWTSFTKLLSLV